ncbi:MAG TPA: hypothetical protein V6C57_27240 [Coleofasciculaceae cyanobacterium]
MAKVSEDYFMAQHVKQKQLGLHERRIGIVYVDNYRARGCLNLARLIVCGELTLG